ncbi:hypothetical protein CS8_035160 [Cupriavidus sp. 8B]
MPRWRAVRCPLSSISSSGSNGCRFRAAADPKVNSIIQNAGSPVLYMNSPQFQAYWDKVAGKFATAVRKIGKVE